GRDERGERPRVLGRRPRRGDGRIHRHGARSLSGGVSGILTSVRRPLALAALASVALLAGTAHAQPLPGAPKCTIFPADNPWNTPVDTLPVAKNSAAMIKAIGLH